MSIKKYIPIYLFFGIVILNAPEEMRKNLLNILIGIIVLTFGLYILDKIINIKKG